MDTAVHRAFRFAGYTLDVTRGALRNGEHAIELRPKSFEVLRYLVENAGRLISKDEIIRADWSNVVVSDESLTRCISDVRAALADERQRIIKTVPRRGYIFDVPVLETGMPGAAAAGVASVETSRRPAGRGNCGPGWRPPAHSSWCSRSLPQSYGSGVSRPACRYPTDPPSPSCRSSTWARTRSRTISATVSPRTSSPICRNSQTFSSSPATRPSPIRARASSQGRSVASSACAISCRGAYAANRTDCASPPSL